uniref:Uncharacterized protein n=1 Tax=Aegilops tauschii subsp. strangulata TaxID=200361 RepID=A0A453QEV7_AEGTS
MTDRGFKIDTCWVAQVPSVEGDQFFTMELIKLMSNFLFFWTPTDSSPRNIRWLHLAPFTRSSHDLILLCMYTCSICYCYYGL